MTYRHTLNSKTQATYEPGDDREKISSHQEMTVTEYSTAELAALTASLSKGAKKGGSLGLQLEYWRRWHNIKWV